MLIAISGAQGSGKSTVLNELKKVGANIVERKTARSVLAEFPVNTLDEIYADPDLATVWQDKILERKMADEFEAYKSEDLWYTERTYADLFTYACMAVGKNNAKSEWLDEYYLKCKSAQNNFYLYSYFLMHHGCFGNVNDGVRGINQHYASMIGVTIQEFLEQMVGSTKYMCCDDMLISSRVKLITHTSISVFYSERVTREAGLCGVTGDRTLENI